MKLFHIIVIGITAATITSCGSNSGSSLKMNDFNPMKNDNLTVIQPPVTLGESNVKPFETLIYYANETRPNSEEADAYDYVLGLMRGTNNSLLREAAQKMSNDTTEFALAVDGDIASMLNHMCSSISSGTKRSLIVFSNKLTRQGKYLKCDLGRSSIEVASNKIANLISSDEFTSDYRLRSNPNAHSKMLQLALGIAKTDFSPATNAYTLVTKSHGSSDTAVSIRMSHDVNMIKSTPGGEAQFIAELEELANERTQKVQKLVNDEIAIYQKYLEIIQNIDQSGFTNSDDKNIAISDVKQRITFLQSTLTTEDGALKESMLKDALLKDGILKDGILKNAILKNSILKDALLKNGVLKEGTLKQGTMKIGLLKDGLMKEGLMKDAMLAAKEEAPAGGILVRSTKPKIGISKAAYVEIIGRHAAPSPSRDWVDPATQLRLTANGSMYFALLFIESCASYLPSELISKSDSKLRNVHKLVTSDGSGIDSYQTVDYNSFLSTLSATKTLAEKLAERLLAIATSQQE